jgi:hypothetical protein
MNNIPIVDQSTKTKAYSVRVTMKNNRLRTLLNDALNSPLGSTKRKKASGALRSISHSANKEFTGKGGGSFQGAIPWLAEKTSNFISSGINNPGNNIMPGLVPSAWNSIKSGAQSYGQNVKDISKNISGGVKDIGTGLFGGDFSSNQTYNPMFINNAPKIDTSKGAVPGSTSSVLPQQSSAFQSMAPGLNKPQAKNENEEMMSKLPESMIPTLDNRDYSGPEYSNNVDAWAQTSDQINSSSETLTQLDSWWGSLSSDQQSYWKDAYEAVSAGIGPEMFAFQVMTDDAAIKRMFPDMPEDMLPKGATLARQLNDLSTTLRKEKGVDMQLNNLMSMIKSGFNISADLNGYITQRDQYLSTIDTMMDGAKDAMSKMDMGNPFVAQRMQNYNNYLLLLRGRHAKRYADFVTDATNEYTAKTELQKFAYEQAMNEYQTEYQFKANITAEDFNFFKGALTTMYDNLAGQETNAYNLQKLQAELQGTLLDNAKKTVELMGTNSSNYAFTDYNNNKNDWTAQFENAEGNFDILSGGAYSIDDLATMWGGDPKANKGNIEDAILQFYNTDVSRQVQSDATAGNSLDLLGYFTDTVLPDYLNQPGMTTEIYNQRLSKIAPIVDKLTTQYKSGINSYIGNNISTIRTSLEDIYGKKGYKAKNDKQGFIDKYTKQGLTEDVLEMLWGATTAEVPTIMETLPNSKNKLVDATDKELQYQLTTGLYTGYEKMLIDSYSR